MGPRPTQPRNMHRGNQGGTQHVVAIPNVATSTGQPQAMYPQNITVPGTPTMYVSGQIPNLQQTPVYPMNNHMQPLIAVSIHKHCISLLNSTFLPSLSVHVLQKLCPHSLFYFRFPFAVFFTTEASAAPNATVLSGVSASCDYTSKCLWWISHSTPAME